MEYVSTHPVMRDYGASRAESNEVISRCPQSYSLMASCLGERPFDCAIVGPQPSGWRDQVTAFIGRRAFITLLGGAAAEMDRAWALLRSFTFLLASLFVLNLADARA